MHRDTSRRQLLKAAATGTATAAGLTGIASANTTGGATNPATEATYPVATYDKTDFVPMELTVPVGATVTFIGNSHPHSVTSTDSLFDVLEECGEGGRAPYNGDDDPREYNDGEPCETVFTSCLQHTVSSPNEAYSVFLENSGIVEITYEAPGRYSYYCVPHCDQFMAGEIHVVGEGE